MLSDDDNKINRTRERKYKKLNIKAKVIFPAPCAPAATTHQRQHNANVGFWLVVVVWAPIALAKGFSRIMLHADHRLQSEEQFVKKRY